MLTQTDFSSFSVPTPLRPGKITSPTTIPIVSYGTPLTRKAHKYLIIAAITLNPRFVPDALDLSGARFTCIKHPAFVTIRTRIQALPPALLVLSDAPVSRGSERGLLMEGHRAKRAAKRAAGKRAEQKARAAKGGPGSMLTRRDRGPDYRTTLTFCVATWLPAREVRK